MADDLPKGPVILWLDYGTDGWRPCSYPSIRAALEDRNSWFAWRYIITRPVEYEIVEHKESAE